MYFYGFTPIAVFPFLFAFDIGGLGFEFGMFVAGWRHALRSEWPFIIVITTPIADRAVVYKTQLAEWRDVVSQACMRTRQGC